MIADFEGLIEEIAGRLSPQTHATAVALAALPLEVKGFGHVKDANYQTALRKAAALMDTLRHPAPARAAAE
jgi:indolepyruvate ferredoxin oxidoreductase